MLTLKLKNVHFRKLKLNVQIKIVFRISTRMILVTTTAELKTKKINIS